MSDEEKKDQPDVEIAGEEIREPGRDERMWAMFCHLSALVSYAIGIPAVGPLIVWALKKDQYPLVDDQGKEAINFQLTVFLLLIASVVLIFAGVGLILTPAVMLYSAVVTIIASVKANEGVAYRYPLCIRFI
jgi:uncharacterized Tic20 family protein